MEVESRKWSTGGARAACVLAALWVVVAGAETKPAVAPQAKPPFSAELVRQRARELAGRRYQAPESKLPPDYARLSYDQYRDIRYRNDQARWRDAGLPFQAQFFHPGFLYTSPVTVHEVDGGRVETVRFSPELFDYGALVKAPAPAQLDGFAGFRLTHPLNRPDHFDEVVSFLGASYFRSLGRGNVYGLSARGLAIDTALPEGEEFPSFREFWLEKPAPGADRAVVHALLDSPSVTGAYRFVIIPGERTVVEVEAALYTRKAVKRLGVAPLTSMYLFGENDRGTQDDFRPEVHDSDGLVIWMKSGEHLWRPLQNPARLSVSSFHVEGLRAFGLLQRDQAFSSYEDLEARYDKRPSVWVEPMGDWGRGAVQLVEIPTPQEVHDNIVAFWVPETPVGPGAELRLGWRLSWGSTPPERPTVGLTTATRIAAGSTAGARRFVLEFSRGGAEGAGPVEAVVTTSKGQVLRPIAQRNDVTGGWRATFELVPEAGAPAELRCFLRRGSETLTETWSYLWTP
ncbi:glucan biosynthesis protein [Vitiosangium sp. GDMCC 1.1324]|uniref:glucan biosynthesis protein n=1 Tax=Vitiosangium sp. (strain GDMCC 1.1324) TaxID=2138576 RepID=UPI000D33FA7F|nr:glucan biosynthesis protein G [Vitiosangium sp. GDMCC 1.1324]PTL75846.1 glucan biosynthesis protein D [Vitiosangium sp. GDMCC 1.1324]